MSRVEKKKGAASERGSSRVIAQFEPTTLQCVGILTVLVLVFFHRIVLGQAYFWEDFIYQNYPFRNFAATSLAMGEIPLWNPYTFNGMPFLADIQTTVLYVPSLLLTLFVRDGRLNYYWLELMIILHFVLAGAGMFFLARSFNLKNIPSLFAGAAYMLSGYMIVHAIHQQNVTLVAWYPLIFLLFRKALREQRWLYVFVCGLVLGHSILAGYPQLSLFLYFFLALYFLLELLSTCRGKELLSRPAIIMSAKAAGIVAISLALAMIQLLPTFELSDLSQRAQITFGKASEGSLAWSQLATLFFPKMFGTAGANGYEYFGPGQYFYFWETCVYLGALPLLLAALSFVQRNNRNVAFFLGIALFSILFALGNNFFLSRFFYEFVPGFSTFRIPARMGILLTFSISLLSAFALQRLLYSQRDQKEKRSLRNILFGIVGVGIVLSGLIVSGSFPGTLEPEHYSQVASSVKSSSMLALFVLLASTASVLWIVRGPNVRFLGLSLVFIFFADMFLFGGNQNNGEVNPAGYFSRRSDLTEFLKKEGEQELFRFNSRNAQGLLPGWDRNQGMVDRIFMMEGYTPLALQRAYAPLASGDQSFDLLNVKYKTIYDERTGQQTLAEHTTRLPRAFFVYNIHVTKSESDLLAFLKSAAFDHRTTAVLENEPGRMLSTTPARQTWEARITNYTNNRITIESNTSHDGLLVLSEIYYPGWRAYVDGIETEIHRANYNLRSLLVNAGKHDIELKFEPSTFRNGMWISIAALLCCVTGIFLSQRTKSISRVSASPR